MIFWISLCKHLWCQHDLSGFTAIDVRVGDLKHKAGNLLWYKSNNCNNHVLESQSVVYHNKGSSEPLSNQSLCRKYLSHRKCLRVRLIMNLFLFYMMFLCSCVVYGCLRRNRNGKGYDGKTKGRSKQSNGVRIEVGSVRRTIGQNCTRFRRLSV